MKAFVAAIDRQQAERARLELQTHAAGAAAGFSGGKALEKLLKGRP